MNPHFMALEAAYQLHYYLCFKTQFLKPTFKNARASPLVDRVLSEVCNREQYHLLESKLSNEHLRLLVSLQPTQRVADTVKMLKGNLQNHFRKELDINGLWAKGYFARSSGRVDLDRVGNYIDSQVRHHGYRGDWTKPLKYKNPEFKSPAFEFGHCVSLLQYHFVFVTQERIALFDEVIAPKLFSQLTSIGKSHQFAVERIGLLPDHMHMLIEGMPTVSPEEYALRILSETSDWMEQMYVGVLKNTGAWDVWQPSYYVGTVGEYTTAQVDKFLRG